MRKQKRKRTKQQQPRCRAITTSNRRCRGKAEASGYCRSHEIIRENYAKQRQGTAQKRAQSWLDARVLGRKGRERDIPYRQYLKTAHWHLARREMLKLAAWRCSKCGAENKPLDVHHRTYDRLWQEKRKDLTVLCRDCHKEEHHADHPG